MEGDIIDFLFAMKTIMKSEADGARYNMIVVVMVNVLFLCCHRMEEDCFNITYIETWVKIVEWR